VANSVEHKNPFQKSSSRSIDKIEGYKSRTISKDSADMVKENISTSAQPETDLPTKNTPRKEKRFEQDALKWEEIYETKVNLPANPNTQSSEPKSPVLGKLD